MLTTITSNYLLILSQGSGAAPPPPKMGPAPPVGDLVPIDGSIWVLIIAALGIIVYHSFLVWKETRKAS
ncbi:hypothetical protein [Nonlabens marinus]|uniref:hypothetical protein n=1 Tax=Nonlabens marinus TaxID=930802 RepID=UPI0011DE47ED|nr:hypothetical protein [Nonlabens marinus]